MPAAPDLHRDNPPVCLLAVLAWLGAAADLGDSSSPSCLLAAPAGAAGPPAAATAGASAPGDRLLISPSQAVAPQCARQGRLAQRQAAGAFGGGVFLAAWSDGSRQADAPAADIYCARLDAAGKPLDPGGIRICGAADLQEYPAVAFDGSNFLVVWQDFRSGRDYDVYAARVSPAGKVFDPDGFVVSAGPGNQARPAVAFAAGSYLVVWMDARHYPVYGLYAARVTPQGKVLDPDGRVLDAESPQAIAKAAPPQPTWLGDRHYWWQRLSSRFQPAAASDGRVCLVTYLRDVHSNQTAGWAMLVNPADGSAAGVPVKLSGEPKSGLAPCAVSDGWAVAVDHWVAGWSPTARLAALRLDGSLRPRDEIPARSDSPRAPAPANQAPMLDVQKNLAGGGGEYQQGKGHFAFWQTAAAWTGRSVVIAMDYAWRQKARPAELTYIIAAARLDPSAGRFLDDPPAVAARGTTAEGTCPRRPALVTGPDGAVLLLYEHDAGLDKLTIEARLLREGPG